MSHFDNEPPITKGEYPLSHPVFRRIMDELEYISALPDSISLTVDSLDEQEVPEEIGGETEIGREYVLLADDQVRIPEEARFRVFSQMGRTLLTPILAYDIPDTLLGNISFSKDSPGNYFTGSMLLLEKGDIYIEAEYGLENPYNFQDELRSFTRRLGLVDVWRKLEKQRRERQSIRLFADQPTGYYILDALTSIREDNP